MTLHEIELQQGDWFKSAVEIIRESDPNDAIAHLFSLAQVNDFMVKTKKGLAEEILEVVSEKLEFADTGGQVEFDLDFFTNIGYPVGSLRTFRQHLKRDKVPLPELIQLHQFFTGEENVRPLFTDY